MHVFETFIKQEHKHYQFFFCFLSFLLLRQSHHATLAGSSWPRTHRALPNSAGITLVPLCLASFLITDLLKRKKKVEVILNHKSLPLFCSKGLIVMIMLQFLLYSEKNQVSNEACCEYCYQCPTPKWVRVTWEQTILCGNVECFLRQGFIQPSKPPTSYAA